VRHHKTCFLEFTSVKAFHKAQAFDNAIE